MLSFYSLFLSTTLLFLFLFCFCSFFNLTFSMNYFMLANLNNFFFTFNFDLIFWIFLLMVMTVTWMVLCFSEVYMKSYKNFKFLLLMFLFFSSMIFLIISGGVFNLMMGWEFLGLTSIFLIMFYMNKQTQINSILTMSFNRIGDVFFALTVFIFFDAGTLFFFSGVSLTYWFYFLLLCSFTKSAQFPFSSWLPAAMSAPTPISAMVHSSTLVTAGVLLIMKFKNFYLFTIYMEIFQIICVLGFVLGAIMANLEIDFKKLIAYSTLSQVSMVFFFVLFYSSTLGMVHMFFHALFKSFLFSLAGYVFMAFYSNQFFNLLGGGISKITHSCLLLCVYSMSGLFYSSSFYTKDFCLEFLMSGDYFFLFLIFFMGSVFSISYGSKILKIFEPGFSSIFTKSNNLILSSTLLGFFMLNLIIGNFHSFLPSEEFVSIGHLDLFLMSCILISFLLINFMSNNLTLAVVFNVGGMKIFSFNFLKNIYFSFFKFISKDDFFFFHLKENFSFSMHKSYIMLIFLCLLNFF